MLTAFVVAYNSKLIFLALNRVPMQHGAFDMFFLYQPHQGAESFVHVRATDCITVQSADQMGAAAHECEGVHDRVQCCINAMFKGATT